MADNILTRKLGPFPGYVWGAGGLAVALGVSVLLRGRAAKQDTTATDTTSSEPADQVPDFISNSYVTVNNPGAPAPPTSGGTTAQSGGPLPVTPPVQLPKQPTPAKPSTPAKPAGKATSYTVKHGDTLSSIAKRYGTTWQALWTYNTTKGHRPDSTIATLKKRGPNLLYAGETILIPPKK